KQQEYFLFCFDRKMNWNSAVSYCENLELVGFSDWRLPNKNELETARNNRNSFKNLRSKTSWYWSISNNNNSRFWIGSFNFGDGSWDNQADDSFAVCVRDL
ncbi:Protein of unknown function (DUF1566), partial [Thiovulum sp. ES]